jgi:hypothetical protein
MEAAGGDPEADAPSEALLDLRRCIAEYSEEQQRASDEETPAQPTHGLSGFVSALQRWHDDSDSPPLELYSQVHIREPSFELGEATFDVLLEFYDKTTASQTAAWDRWARIIITSIQPERETIYLVDLF